MPGIIGKKIGMTSIYNEAGRNIPCTIIEAGPCVVSHLKTKEKDGYEAIQLSFDERREKSTPSALIGHFKKAGTTPKRKIAEFSDFDRELNLGDVISVDIFEEGEFVDVVGKAKGRGFQGVVKRHGFSGVGERTHGQHNRERAPGSIGAGSDPSRVFKGMRMAGQMGNNRVKLLNLEVVKILPERNMLIVKGAVPGARGAYVLIEK